MSQPIEPVDVPRATDPTDTETLVTASGLQSSAMRASLWTAIQAMIGLPLSVVVNLVVARTLGPHGFGLVASYMAAYGLVLIVLNAGISDATIQWGAAAYARGDRTELLAICRRCAGFHLLFEAPLSIVAALFLLRHESLTTQVVAAVAIALTMACGTTTVALTAVSMNTRLAKLNIVVGFSIQLAVLTAAVQSHAPGPTWAARIALSTLAPLGAVLLAPADIRRATFAPLIPRGWPPGFARYGVRTLVAGLVTTLVFSRCEILVLDAYGETASAGLFALAAGLASQMTAPVDAMLGPLIPAAASLVEIGRERAAPAVLKGIRLSALATAPIATLAIPSLAVLTPVLYGGRFASTGALLVSLAAVSCLQSVLHPVTAFVAALRRPLLVLAINAAALAADLLLVVALVPAFGAVGAVVGNSAGQLISLAVSLWVLRANLSLGLREAASALIPFVGVAAASITGAVLGIVLRDHGASAVLAAVAGVAFATVVGAVVARAAGGIVTNTDLAGVQSALPRAAAPVVSTVGALGLVRR